MVSDHHIGLSGQRTGTLRETFLRHRAMLGAQTFKRGHRSLPPRPIRNRRDQLIPVPCLALFSPLPDAHDLLAQRRSRAVLGRIRVCQGRIEKRARVLILRIPARELIFAHIVVPPLEQGDVHRPRKFIFQSLQKPRNIAPHNLGLQRQRCRSHHHRFIRLDRVPDRRNQVRHRLTRAGPGLHQQVRTRGQSVRNRMRHLMLTIAALPTHLVHRRGQQTLNLFNGGLTRLS